MTPRRRLFPPSAGRALRLVGAGVCLALAVGLGLLVGRGADPAGLMGVEHALVGAATPLAIAFTWLCYPQVLVPLGIALLFLAWRLPHWRARVLWSLVSLLAAWRLDALMQHLFARPRRQDWVYKHEISFSYPSSHAAIVGGFYLFWAALLLTEPPLARWRAYLGGLLVALSLGILWSRLALGAHYATDILGGLLVGTTVGLLLRAFAPM